MKTSRAMVEECLARAADPSGEGKFVFTRLDPERANRAADAMDALRSAGAQLSPIAGLPISVKDLFDVEGEVTTAGSPQFRTRPAAKADSPVIRRLKQAGAVIIGRTNMSEFAFTGVGINPHFGTPANVWDRARRRIPGGSSSGAAVSVTDGMAMAAIGSDTGGSVRIPAALCGLAGFKPTQRRVPLEGVFPLSGTLDSIGPLARTVHICAALDAVLSGDDAAPLPSLDLRKTRMAVPTNYFLDGLDAIVANAWESALSQLAAAGVQLVFRPTPEMDRIAATNAKGGFSAPEAYTYHRHIATRFDAVDPFVRERILRGKDVSSADYLDMFRERRAIIRDFENAFDEFDCVLCPTVPIVAPQIQSLVTNPDAFRRVNMLLLRNPSVVNFLNRCALSIPCQRVGDAPAGLMLIGKTMGDRALLAIGAAVETVLRGTTP